MNLNGPYYSYKKPSYNQELQDCIEQTCQIAINRISVPDKKRI